MVAAPDFVPRSVLHSAAKLPHLGRTVVGIAVDQGLVTVTADVRSLQEMGADITRHNLASDPIAFTDDGTVRAFMHTAGSTGLPLTVGGECCW